MSEEIRIITKEQYNEYMELKKQFVDATKKVERWKPKDGGTYWIITGNGKVEWQPWDGSKWDMGFYNLHNCFETEEQAQKELDRRLAEQELLDLVDGSVNDDEWVEIEYEPDNDRFTIDCYSTITTSCYRFASRESCQKAIDTLGTEKLKLIFRID